MPMKTIFLLHTLFLSLFATITPDYFTKEGFCVVETKEQKILGLTRFNTKKEFQKSCNSKMIFKYKEDRCRYFTMKSMKFNIYIEDRDQKTLFRVGEIREVCGKTIIEEIID
ncbi:hypothetical protein [Halarcobacter ebronensis]|uniref:DUF192 domain-containing protein n=1 Tax=Halarcobacter ebronensis TaxID=1462615 RepID=A0A4Q1AVJ8_9BACT|nr:hypothetical protein [Halarcobacter ebronensis]QKF83425.1 hypothetical protein AEBR_2974 [Halarcobacter ebronensis]RXK05983.1 hypothetical protein CRV07_07895 [Halarcobacter ebronensis]